MAIKPPDGHLDWIIDDDPDKFAPPSGSKRLQGFNAAEKPPFQYFNWAWRLVDRWLKWAEAQLDENVAAISAVTAACLSGSIPAGTAMLFVQTNAPTGWTKSVSHHNKALRIVSGTAGSGGSLAFTTAFAGRTVTGTSAGGTVENHTLTSARIPSHYHGINLYAEGSGGSTGFVATGNGEARSPGATLSVGGSGAHAHGFTGATHNHGLNMAVQYVDAIICVKN